MDKPEYARTAVHKIRIACGTLYFTAQDFPQAILILIQIWNVKKWDIIYDKKTFYIQKMHIISWFGHKARKREENVQNFILKSKGDHDSCES